MSEKTNETNVEEKEVESSLQMELEQVKNERDIYKNAYEQLSEQNKNILGLYSNVVDYVINQTVKR